MAPRLVSVAVPVPIDRPFTYLVPDDLEIPAVGCRVIVPLGRRTVTGVVVARGGELPAGAEVKPLSRVLDAEPLFDEEHLVLARWVADTYLATAGEVLSAMLPSARRERELPLETGDEPVASPAELVLSDEQRAALDAVQFPVAPGSEAWYYLYGITGSGKTEVFLRLAERALAQRAGVIYLVPEIALTIQLFEQIRRRFGDRAAILHSGLTAAQRLGQWRRISSGDARFVVGARSAVFAPVRDLALVVIDEEHEGSYKSGNTPRYHARQVALWRARRAGGACVMGSATPSVEAWHLMREGRLTRLVLTRRLSGGALPAMRVVNMRHSTGLLSEQLVAALRATHAEGAQSILFLNRRGFASAFMCRSCGTAVECPRCSVPMTYHKARSRLVCHYCGYTAAPATSCAACGSLDVGFTGFGTERIEQDLATALPTARIARLDTDVTARVGVLRETLGRFAAGEIDVLLGTQMVAKGLNFPGVRTVGIVMAETGLSLPDFRAAERTFNLIVQVAGRAGRFRSDGEVIVQTLRPEHPAIRAAVELDVERFYAEELDTRRSTEFPPYTRLLRLVARSRDRGHAEAAARALAASVEQWIAARVPAGESPPTVLGPAPAPLERLNGSWRYHLILSGVALHRLRSAARHALAAARRHRSVYVEADVDPVALL